MASPLPASLEERIWTSDDETLPSLEREGVRLVQTDPGSAYYHFLLSHTYLRMFANDQQDVESLRAASELATQSLELAPDEEFGYVAMAEVLEALGQNNKAMAYWPTLTLARCLSKKGIKTGLNSILHAT